MFVCTTLRAQTLNFVLSVDTIAIGDTLTVNNTSSYPPNTIFVWNNGEYCRTTNLTGIAGGEVLINDSLCNDTVIGSSPINFIYEFPGNKTISLKVAGSNVFLTKNIYVIYGGGCFNQCNLVNGDFEQFNQQECPYTGQSGMVFTAWPSGVNNIVDCWSLVPPGTCDFYTQACNSTTALGNGFGGSLPHSADSYIGLIPYVGTPTGNLTQYREYFTQQLSFSIRPNCDYHVGVYAKIASNGIAGTTGYGDVGLPLQVQLTDLFPNQFVGSTFLLDINSGLTSSFTPAISSNTNWQLIETTFNSGIVTGTKFLTVGNYYNNTNTQLTDPLKNDQQIYIFLDSLFIEFVDFTSTISDVTCVQNGSINLTSVCGTAPFTYQWSNGATTQNITNLSSGNYTVTITDAKGLHFTDSYNVPNTSCTPQLSATVNNTCSGSCNGQIDLTVSGNCNGTFTYLWSNGATTEDIIGLCAGTYTVTVTAQNGCTATANYTVTAETAPIISFDYLPLQCQGTYSLQNPTVGIDYYWEFRDNAGNLIFSNTGSGGLTSVTLPPGASPSQLIISADNNGCKVSKTFLLGECCPPDPNTDDFAVYGNITLSQLVVLLQANRPSWVNDNTINGQPQQGYCVNIIPSKLVYYKLNTGLTVNTTNNLFIYGNLTIDKSIDLSEFSLVMAADREVIVNNNVSVTLHSDIGVFFNTCGKYMWRGIRLLGSNSKIYARGQTSHLSTYYNNQINDAVNGINSSANGKFYLSNTLFNRNLNGIFITNSNATINNSYITDCFFTSKDNALINDQVLLENPINNTTATRSRTGISLTRLNNTVIGYDEALDINGTYANTACYLGDQFNKFENIDYGIWLQRCAGIEVYRNEFKRIIKGIRTSGDASNAASISVGKAMGVNLSHNNIFDQFTENGIELTGNASIAANNNFFYNTTLISGSSDKLRSDIEFNNAYSLTKNSIMNNEFSHYYYAAVYLHNNTSGTMSVDVIGNKFYGRLNPTNGNPWSVYGIYADAAPANKYVMNINKNLVIDDTRYGIRIRNNDNANIVGNILTYHMASNVTFNNNTQWIRGIFLSNSSLNKVEMNHILWSNYPAGFSITYPDKLQGISMENVTNSNIICNKMDGMGAGVYIQNNNIGTSYITNITKNCYNGYKLNNASIDPVGDPSTLTSYNNPFSNITSFRVAGSISTLAKDWYYIGSNDMPTPVQGGIVSPQVATSALPACINFTGDPDSSQMRTETEMLQQVINNETEFAQFEEENKYLTEEAALKLLKADSLLRDTLPNTENFILANETLGKGKYIEVEKALIEGNMSNATAIIATITDSNLMEENKRTVMEMIIKINDSISLTATDTTLLESIAYTPAIVGGTAVYIARGILAIEVDDESLTSSYRMANDKQKETNKNSLDIYPNPAKDFVFIKCIGSITYEITDVAGKQYKQGDFDLQGNAVVSINIEQLLQGVYIVKATQEDCTKVARIVVIK